MNRIDPHSSPRPDPFLPALRPGQPEQIPGTLTFGEFLAALNPLHHLPVIGTIYRAATGETVAPPIRVLGGALFGGPIGAISAALFAVIGGARATPPPSRPLPGSLHTHNSASGPLG